MKTTKKMKIVTTKGGDMGCAGGGCPTIYQSEDGKFFLQGNKIGDDAMTELNVPDHEFIVELDLELLRNFLTDHKI